MDSSTLQELIRRLNDPDESVRIRAIEDLGAAATPAAVGPLIKRLAGENNPAVLEAIGISLTAMGGMRVINGLLPLLDAPEAEIRNTVCEMLVEMGEEAITPLTALLGDTRKDVRKFAAEIMGDIGSRNAVPVLVLDALADPDSNVACAAAESLGKIADPLAVYPLMDAFESGDASLRYYVVVALGKIMDPAARDFLATAAAGKDPLVRLAAIEALGDLRHPGALNVLVRLLESDDAMIQRCAMKAIGRIDIGVLSRLSREAVAPRLAVSLLAALESDDGELVRYAILVLRNTEETVALKILHEFIGRNHRLPDGIIQAMVKNGSAPLSFLLALQKNGDEPMRELLARALGEVADMNAFGFLVDMMDDNSPLVRLAAVQSLARQPASMMTGAFLRATSDPALPVRCAAIQALGELRAMEAVEVLFPLLADDEYDMVESTMSALAAIGGSLLEELLREGMERATSASLRERYVHLVGMLNAEDRLQEVLFNALKDKSPQVRRAAIGVLGSRRRNGPEDPADRMLAARLKDPAADVRLAAVRSLTRRNVENGTSLLLPLLQDEDVWVRYEVIRSIARFSSKDIVPVLLSELSADDSLLQVAACESLADLGAVQAIEALKGLLAADNAEVQSAAAKALERLGARQ